MRTTPNPYVKIRKIPKPKTSFAQIKHQNGQKNTSFPPKKPSSVFFWFFAHNGLILMKLGNHALINKTSPRAADTYRQKKFKKS